MGEMLTKSDATWVLIVDDVEANRFLLRNIIVEMGYQPVLAENGIQALKIMEKLQPSIILLDVSMPEMDGYELCRILKENPQTRMIPIIFISAYDDVEDIVRGYDIGGEDYITKPFIKEVVQARVGVHLKLYDANQKLIESNRKLVSSVGEQLKQMEQEKKNVLYALVAVARETACYEEEHMERIQYNCRVLSQALQLSPEFESKVSDAFVETIVLAAPLCDLGNVAIPQNILQKETPLTDEEREVLRTHTTVGAKILFDVNMNGDYNDFVKMSIDIAKSHHENWDGSGYPEGISGEEIPLAAQIVALSSSYTSMTEKRRYRDPYTKEQAIEMLEKDVGKKYNPAIFDVCKKIARQLR